MSSPSYYPFAAIVPSLPTYVTDDIDKTIVDAFTCSICIEVLSNDSVHNEGCEHYQCSQCRRRCEYYQCTNCHGRCATSQCRCCRQECEIRNPCPVCRNQSRVVPLTCKLALDVIETFPMICPWPACGEQMKRSDCSRHVDTCDHRQFKCPRCDTHGTLAVLRDHVMHTCEFTCSRGALRCTQRMSHHLLADHETACKMSQDEQQRSTSTLKRERDEDADLRGDDPHHEENTGDEEVQEFQPPTARHRTDPQPQEFPRHAHDYFAHMRFIASEAERERERLRSHQYLHRRHHNDPFPNPQWMQVLESLSAIETRHVPVLSPEANTPVTSDAQLEAIGAITASLLQEQRQRDQPNRQIGSVNQAEEVRRRVIPFSNTWIPSYQLNGERIDGHRLRDAHPARLEREFLEYVGQWQIHRPPPPPQGNIRQSMIIPRPSWLINASEQAQLPYTQRFNPFQ
jgi:hypothetical protein